MASSYLKRDIPPEILSARLQNGISEETYNEMALRVSSLRALKNLLMKELLDETLNATKIMRSSLQNKNNEIKNNTINKIEKYQILDGVSRAFNIN